MKRTVKRGRQIRDRDKKKDRDRDRERIYSEKETKYRQTNR